MPHCVIEYARPLADKCDLSELLRRVHQAAFDSGLFGLEDIKTRALAVDHYLTGSGNAEFVHINLKILSGRSAEQKQQLSQRVLDAAVSFLGDLIASCSVEVSDMDRASYAKKVS